MSRENNKEDARATAETVVRQSYGKLLAYLAARTRNVAAAEDALSEALAAALTSWPVTGIPARPEAWLLTTARRKTIDAVRRQRGHDAAEFELQTIAEELQALESMANEMPDDRLALMFACAHPAIDTNIRAPLILQTILGFDAATIASAFLVAPATMGQRLVRAKAKIKQAGIPFRIPERADLPQRLDAVLEAIYAAFAEGWSDPAGTEIRRRNLAEEGIWLGRLVASLLPDEPEALGLLALMLFAEARRAARRTAQGDYVPLADQDMSLWDASLIDEAEALLFKASGKGTLGRYQLEAAIQSAHVARRISGRTDWAAIEHLYTALATITGSPVVAINRAIATAETRGAGAGLAELDAVAIDARLNDYQPYWAARAGLLVRTGQIDEAVLAYERAIGLEADPAVRRFLQQRRAALQAAD
jgi:RNA polymerase sigma-70 factor, ECF subfamily